ncbi:hypothetical protein D3C72_1333880 [compost metagenome]
MSGTSVRNEPTVSSFWVMDTAGSDPLAPPDVVPGTAVLCTRSMYENVVRTAWVTGRRFSVSTGTLLCRTIAPMVLSVEKMACDPCSGPLPTEVSSVPAPKAAAAGMT